MKLTVASSPHIRGNFRTNRIMMDVVIALMPALIVGILQFGIRAFLNVLVSAVSAVATEWLYCVIMKKRNTVILLSLLFCLEQVFEFRNVSDLMWTILISKMVESV